MYDTSSGIPKIDNDSKFLFYGFYQFDSSISNLLFNNSLNELSFTSDNNNPNIQMNIRDKMPDFGFDSTEFDFTKFKEGMELIQNEGLSDILMEENIDEEEPNIDTDMNFLSSENQLHPHPESLSVFNSSIKTGDEDGTEKNIIDKEINKPESPTNCLEMSSDEENTEEKTLEILANMKD